MALKIGLFEFESVCESDGASDIYSYSNEERSQKEQSQEDLVGKSDLKTLDFPDGGLKAWGVVAAAWCTAFASLGTANSFGVYETYYRQTLLHHDSPSDISWIGALQTFSQFSATLLAGALTDRYGPMVVLLPFSMLLVVASMLTSLCQEYYQFILCQGILLGISCGFLYAPALTVVGQYFLKRRPLAMSLASTGSPIAGVVYPVVLNTLIPRTGFGWAQRTCALITLALLAVAAVLLRPTRMRRKNKLLLLGAFKKPAYTLQVAGVFMLLFALWIPYFYIAGYGLKYGMAPSLANYLFAIINAGSFVGRVCGGYLAQWLGQFNVATFAGVGAAVLVFAWSAMRSTGALIALAGLYGACSGLIIALMTSTLASSADHPTEIGTYIGQACFVFGLATLSGTPIAGALISAYGYNAGIYFTAASLLLGAGFMGGARYFHEPNKLKA